MLMKKKQTEITDTKRTLDGNKHQLPPNDYSAYPTGCGVCVYHSRRLAAHRQSGTYNVTFNYTFSVKRLYYAQTFQSTMKLQSSVHINIQK